MIRYLGHETWVTKMNVRANIVNKLLIHAKINLKLLSNLKVQDI